MSQPNVKVPQAPQVAKSNVASSINGKVFGVFSKIKSMFSGTHTPLIILIVITILLFVLIIIWISFSIKSSNLKGKILTTNPIKLNSVSKPIEISATDIPKPNVGREYSYSFWLYLEDFDPISNNHKLVFYRGAENSMSTVNPIVFLDGQSNKLYIAIKTQGNTLSQSSLVNYNTGDLTNIIDYNYFINKNNNLNILTPSGYQSSINLYMILAIDYIPLQRWVNIVTIVDNKMITLYMDGEIYSVKTSSEFKSMRKPEMNPIDGQKFDPTLIVDKPEGSIYIGKSINVGGGNSPNGYLSKLEFYNYAIGINDVRNIYNKGPLNGFFSSTLNVPYGVRSPVYKLSDSVVGAN
jgi:hypothetical protein